MENQPPYPSSTAQKTNTLAVVSLITGILGLVGVLPLIGSVIAIITGNMARKEIAGNPMLYTGDGLARGGQITGWIGVGLAVVGCICVAVVFALGGLGAIFGTETSSLLLPTWSAF